VVVAPQAAVGVRLPAHLPAAEVTVRLPVHLPAAMVRPAVALRPVHLPAADGDLLVADRLALQVDLPLAVQFRVTDPRAVLPLAVLRLVDLPAMVLPARLPVVVCRLATFRRAHRLPATARPLVHLVGLPAAATALPAVRLLVTVRLVSNLRLPAVATAAVLVRPVVARPVAARPAGAVPRAAIPTSTLRPPLSPALQVRGRRPMRLASVGTR
jgi:hypothetical protein